MSIKINGNMFRAFDIHGHPENTIPSVWKIFHKGVPEDIAIKDFQRTGLNGGIISAIGDVNSFYPVKRNQTKSVYKQIECIKRKIAQAGYTIITSPDDLCAIMDHDKVGFIIGVEGGDFLQENIDILYNVYDAGVRCITLVHFSNNSIGDVCMDLEGNEPASLKDNPRGLTDFGGKVVQTMNELGMIVDIAHSSERTAFEVLELSRAPVMCSHTGPRAMQNFPRFISNDLMVKIAKNGGIIGMWLPYFKGFGPRNVEEFGDFVRYTVNVVGIDAVSIGTDFNGVPAYADGYSGLKDFHILGEVLFKKGFSKNDIEKIFIGNFKRFCYDISKYISPHIKSGTG